MYKEVALGVLQGATEFLPISSSGHLALLGNFFGEVNLFYITLLHVASLLAILIYTRKEIKRLVTFEDEEAKNMWLFLAIGIIPAGLFGLFFHSFIESAFTSPLLIGIGFIFTGNILILCYGFKETNEFLTKRKALYIGLVQILALFPGVSRSGTTISFGLFTGLKREEAFRFSFLMAIPLIVAASLFNFSISSITVAMMVGFVVCFIISLASLKILEIILKKNYFWVFGVYCLSLGVLMLLQTF